MGKRTKELEARLEQAERDLRSTSADLAAYQREEERQRLIAEDAQRKKDREAEQKRLDDLSNGVVDLAKIRHDFGFDYDDGEDGGTVTITLHASDQEAQILNRYATQGRRATGGKIEVNTSNAFPREIDNWLRDFARIGRL